MNWLSELTYYANTLLLLVALILSFRWQKRRGKQVLCAFLVCAFLTAIVYRVMNLMVRMDILDWSSSVRRVLDMVGTLANFAGHILLLAFVIMAAKAPPAESSARVSSTHVGTILSKEDRRAILHRREWTYVLDVVFINIVCAVLGLAVGTAGGRDEAGPGAAMLIGGLLGILYFLFKDSFSGTSLGKAMTGLRVVDATSLQPIGPGQSIARNWIFLIPIFPLVELIVANIREDKRRLGDLMANTIVLRPGREPALPPTANAVDDNIRVTCPECSKSLNVPMSAAGRRGKCPVCGTSIVVPS